MKTNRLEAFSDGVIAVIITIMVLELKPPHEATVAAIGEVLPSLLVYGLSFLVVAIMWINHHHFLDRALRADTLLLWSNNNLLFWMSLIPFVTAYLGQNHRTPMAVAAYGLVLALVSASFLGLQTALARQDKEDPKRSLHFRRMNWKAGLSFALYASAAGLAFRSVSVSLTIFVLIPLMYFWPERETMCAE